MILAQEGGEDKPCNCISHEFFRSASRDPGKIAIVHAQGGLQLCKELQAAYGRGEIPASDEEKRLIDSFRELPSPPVYRGDLCFTYGDILLAVESLSRRIRRVLDGGDDPDLVRPKGYAYRKRVSGIQNSEPSVSFHRMPQIVGVHASPSTEYVVAVLSILRCGEAFLPLDPLWPRERLASVAACSKADLIITCITASNKDGSILNNETHWTEECDFSTLCFLIGKDTAEVAMSDLDWPCETKRRRLYCYLMYTSGSTGKPKGVCGSETGLINRFLWMQQFFPAFNGDILLFKTPISFIDHIQEFLFAVLSCNPLIIPSFDELKADPFGLIDILKVYHISRLVIVPSLVRATLFSSGRSHWMHVQKTLRLLMLSGEILSISLWEVLQQFLPETVILNLYGSTEVSGDCTYFDCSYLPKILESEKLNSVPIGVPVPNCNVTLLQQGMSDEGEICVSGSCLFVGYFDDLPHNGPYEDIHSLPFKTGDFAKCLQSGNLLFVGRKDRMVKVNGQRIALEEIEHALREHPAVTDAAVVTKNPREPASHIFLKAYVVLVEHERAETSVKQFSLLNKDGGEKFLMISIRSWLTRKLPPVMVPSYFSFVKSLPMCSTGKVDYSILESLLPFPKGSVMKFDEKQCFRDFLQIIKKAFCDVLLVEEINDNDDFFMMGGSSILAALLVHKLGIDMRLLYSYPSPVGLLDAIINGKAIHETAFHSDELQTKRLKLNNALGGVNSEWPKLLVNSSGGFHQIESLRQLESVRFSYSDNGASGYHNLDISKLNLPRLCSLNRCNRCVFGEMTEVDETRQCCLKIEAPKSKGWVLKEIWRVHSGLCVDASPLLVLKNGEFHLFIGSHSCIFFSIDALSGFVRWKTNLEGRIECSAAITSDFSHVVVGCYEGKIYFLDFTSGIISWVFQTHGQVKMQPIAWNDLVWCGAHDHWLYALDYVQQQCVYKILCGGSLYGSPSVDTVQSMIYVASTSGRVTAISVENSPYKVAWVYESGAPIFGSLKLDSSTGNVICCLVNGRVIALNTKGSVVWEAVTGGPVFAGASMSFSLPSQVLICCRNGGVYSFDSASGDVVWEYRVSDPITSSAFVDEHVQLISEPSQCTQRLVCICSTSGNIHVLRVDSDAIKQGARYAQYATRTVVEEVARMALPGDIFSSPVMIGGLIFVGCRDDHVRCINVLTDLTSTKLEYVDM